MAKAAQISCGRMREFHEKMQHFEDLFLGLIRNNIPMAYLQGASQSKVPWICNICFFGADSGQIRDLLGKEEICVARSSACAEGDDKASHVLEAIGTDEALLNGAVRFSFGARTTDERIQTAAEATAQVVAKLRGQ